jgi:hypothetical protein
MQKINKKIKQYSQSAVMDIQDDLGKNIFHTMMGVLVFFAICYIVLIANIVFSVVERNSFNAKNSILSSEVGELELEYLAMSKNIDLNFAYANGFKETKTEFASSLDSNNSKFARNEVR